MLALLSQRDSYAYEIASRLATDVGMGEGTIYPLMRRMQNDGLVTTYLVESADVLFIAGQPRVRRIFRRDGAGRVTGFIDRREGEDIDWKREATP